jgi:hypothetical protein
VRPLPHPPTNTGIREGEASSAAKTRRANVERGVNMRVPHRLKFESRPLEDDGRERLDLKKRRPSCQFENEKSFT